MVELPIIMVGVIAIGGTCVGIIAGAFISIFLCTRGGHGGDETE